MYFAVESQRGAVLSCEGPASTMGLLAWDCEACGHHSASDREARAGAATGPGVAAHLSRPAENPNDNF